MEWRSVLFGLALCVSATPPLAGQLVPGDSIRWRDGGPWHHARFVRMTQQQVTVRLFTGDTTLARPAMVRLDRWEKWNQPALFTGAFAFGFLGDLALTKLFFEDREPLTSSRTGDHILWGGVAVAIAAVSYAIDPGRWRRVWSR